MVQENPNLTNEQRMAIERRDKTLLVSAAAGSGKTYTLTKRIIESLIDPKEPLNIDAILIVTFTKLAAGELRTKVANALNEAIAKDPDNEHLKRQLNLLPSAKIRTIDGFCNDILRSNCDCVGLSPGYRIADGAEIEILAISIIEGLIEATYNGELPEVATPEEFEELADCLTESGKTEELSSVFRYISLKCENAEEGIDVLAKLIEKYKHGGAMVENTPYGAYLMERFGEMLTHYIGWLDVYEREIAAGSETQRKYLPVIEADRRVLTKLKSLTSYDLVRETINSISWESLPRMKKGEEKTPKMEEYQAFRDKKLKDIIKKEKSKFLYSSDQWRELCDHLHRLLGVFYRFEKKFDTLFREEKKRRGALSYNDIERYTYECLIQNGELTDIAKNVASQFDAIYIDEYQDVNSLQNRIFEAISKPTNRFMVGDIKQSIYSFRSACPGIFADMKNSYPMLDDSTECDQASIFMSANFRCDKGVIDFVNDIFDKAFSFVAKSIGYVDSDRLVYKKKQEQGEPKYRYPVVCSVNKDFEGGVAGAVADKIDELIKTGKLNNGKDIKASDIAIILRDAKGYDTVYAMELERRGIPCCISGAKGFFLSSEVLLALCLLNSIDNPRRDIYLAGLLCSPLFGFTADELILIRQKSADSLYESLVAYTKENPSFTKGKEFLERLNYYRTISEGIGVDTLIHKLYRETGLMSLASKNGGKDNLILLFDYARSFEAGSFKGLYNFISFINNIINKKTTFDDARAKTETDAVKIVTAHGSKGLEYPIVFFVESNKQIKDKDKTRLAYCEDFGFSFKLRTPSGLTFVNNPVRDIIKTEIFRRIFEEELRVLYVLLTRARERLYVVGKCPEENTEEYKAKLDEKRKIMSEYSFRKMNTYQDIILTCKDIMPLSEDELLLLDEEDDSVEVTLVFEDNNDTKKEAVKDPSNGEENHSIDYAEMMRRFNYKYPLEHLTELPEKMSVSSMTPTILDGNEEVDLWSENRLEVLDENKTDSTDDVFSKKDEYGIVFEDNAENISLSEETEAIDSDKKKRRLPAFALGTNLDESAKRGIATHLFMQFCNLENLAENSVVAELDRLCNQGFISEEDKKRVRIREIEMFRKSTLFHEMRQAKKIHRELRFNVYLPATEFATKEEKIDLYKDSSILVQGVIDCIIEKENGDIILCDYKTDRLKKEEILDRTLAEATLREKHSVQLGMYALAVERIFGKPPKRIEIYSLPLGDTVSIK